MVSEAGFEPARTDIGAADFKSAVSTNSTTRTWWASRESNAAPTNYEFAALTKHELEALWRDVPESNQRPTA